MEPTHFCFNLIIGFMVGWLGCCAFYFFLERYALKKQQKELEDEQAQIHAAIRRELLLRQYALHQQLKNKFEEDLDNATIH